MKVIPSNIADKIANPEDRKALGVRTQQEDQRCWSERAEEELQKQIRDLLNRRDVVFINPSMKRRSALPPGWPDFTFCYRFVAIGLECKTGNAACSDEQLSMHARMRDNGWMIYEIRSLKEIQDILDRMDREALK